MKHRDRCGPRQPRRLVQVYLTEDEIAWADRFGKKWNLSRASVLRQALRLAQQVEDAGAQCQDKV